MLQGAWQIIGGIAAGFLIGVVASLLGVAGGELLIPTLVLLFGADIMTEKTEGFRSFNDFRRIG